MTALAAGRTIRKAIGQDAADELVAIAFDVIVDAPLRKNRHSPSTYVSWRYVLEGRAVLDRAGLDWKYVKRSVRPPE